MVNHCDKCGTLEECLYIMICTCVEFPRNMTADLLSSGHTFLVFFLKLGEIYTRLSFSPQLLLVTNSMILSLLALALALESTIHSSLRNGEILTFSRKYKL